MNKFNLLFVFNLLFILPTLILSNTHKGEILFIWKSSKGYEFRDFGDESVHGKYIGDVKNGEPHGLGIMTYSNGTKYVGEWENGKFNGKGKLIIKSETSFGFLNFHNGTHYNGGWKNNSFNGYGVFQIYYHGKVLIEYKGDWKNGEKNGYGEYFTKNGPTYTYLGEYLNDDFHGKGTYIDEDRNKFVGYFKKNIRKGIGTLFRSNGDVLKGDWNNQPWNVKHRNLKGELIQEWRNGVKQK